MVILLSVQFIIGFRFPRMHYKPEKNLVEGLHVNFSWKDLNLEVDIRIKTRKI